MASARTNPQNRRRCRNGQHRADCSGASDGRHALRERQRCTRAGHVRGCSGFSDARHQARLSRAESQAVRRAREKAERRSVTARLREARKRTDIAGSDARGESVQNGQIGGHGTKGISAAGELSGEAGATPLLSVEWTDDGTIAGEVPLGPEMAESWGARDRLATARSVLGEARERDGADRDRQRKEISAWMTGNADTLRRCPLLWNTGRAWVCLICRDVLDSPSVARIHVLGHIDPVGLPTNPPRPKRTVRHLDPVRASAYIVTGPHRKRRQAIPPTLVALAETKLAEYRGWDWYGPAPTMPRQTVDRPMPSTPVPRWDGDEPIPVKPDPLETPERRRLIDAERDRIRAGETYEIPAAHRGIFPDYVQRIVAARGAA